MDKTLDETLESLKIAYYLGTTPVPHEEQDITREENTLRTGVKAGGYGNDVP
jgi:hypothetical protein